MRATRTFVDRCSSFPLSAIPKRPCYFTPRSLPKNLTRIFELYFPSYQSLRIFTVLTRSAGMLAFGC